MGLKRNVGNLDRLIRFVLGAVMFYFGIIEQAITSNMVINIVFGVIGVVFMLVALIGHCPAYKMANISTYKEQ